MAGRRNVMALLTRELALALAMTSAGLWPAANLRAAGNDIEISGTDGDDTVTVEVATEKKAGGLAIAYYRVTLATSGGGTTVSKYPLALNMKITFYGNKGDDRFENKTALLCTAHGEDGDDTLIGGAAGDTMDGGQGADVLFGRDGDDSLDGQDGDDKIYGEGGNDHLSGGDGLDTLHGGSGDDTISGDDGNDMLYGDDSDDVLMGGDGDDQIWGANGEDTLNGGAGNDKLFGGKQGDTLLGKEGNDELDGGNGPDTLSCGDDEDTAHGGEGKDTIDGGEGNDALYGDDGNDSIECGEGLDSANGGEGNDSIDGGGDNDLLYGDDGDDAIECGEGINEAKGGAGNDILGGGSEKDVLWGGDGDDRLYGRGGTDFLYGESGSDGLYGGDDSDSLDGGTAVDRILVYDIDNVKWGDSDVPVYFKDGDRIKHDGQHYTAAEWTQEYVEDTDEALYLLHEKSYRLLQRKGKSITFLIQGPIEEDEKKNSNGWNDNGDIHLLEVSFPNVRKVLIHEVGHNWDKLNDDWSGWKKLSDWVYKLGSPGSDYATSDDGSSLSFKWWYRKNAEFPNDEGGRAREDPYEDFAVHFKIYVMEGEIADEPDKEKFMRDFIANLNSEAPNPAL